MTTMTYSNPNISQAAVDRVWRIASAYCRARVSVGLLPEIDDARALAGDDLGVVDAYRAAIYEWCQQHAEQVVG